MSIMGLLHCRPRLSRAPTAMLAALYPMYVFNIRSLVIGAGEKPSKPRGAVVYVYQFPVSFFVSALSPSTEESSSSKS